MDHGFPKIFGQSCEDSIQDDCAYINSHLNTFDNIDYRGHMRCKMQLDAGDQKNSRYSSNIHKETAVDIKTYVSMGGSRGGQGVRTPSEKSQKYRVS